MRANSEQLESVQKQVALGEYRVSSDRIAEAILARIGATVAERDSIREPEDGRVLLQALNGPRAA